MKTSVNQPKTARSLLMPTVVELLQETLLAFLHKFLHLLRIYVFAFVGNLTLIFIAVGVLYWQGFGAVLSFTGLSPLLAAFHNSRFLFVSSVLLAGLVVCGLLFNVWVLAAYIFLMDDTDTKISMRAYLRKGALYVSTLVGIIGTSLFFVLGGFFLGVLPAVVILFFLSFVLYVAVLERQRGIDAVQMSVSMIKQHLRSVIIRMLLLVLIVILQYVGVRVISYFFHDIGVYETYIHLGGILVLGWFTLSYSYVLYQHTRNAYDDLKPVSLTWLKIVSSIGWFIAIILTIQVIGTLKQYRVANLVVNVLNTGSQIAVYSKRLIVIEPPLESQTLYTINLLRASADNIPYDQDIRLCAFAARRLEQFNAHGGYDENVAYIRDLADPSIRERYIAGYHEVNSLVWERKGYPNEADVIAGTWSRLNENEPDINIISSDYSHACVQADKDFVVLVMGDKASIFD